MSLNAEIKNVITEYRKLGMPEWHDLEPQQAREQMLKTFKPLGLEVPLAKIKSYQVPGPEGDIAVRVYWPESEVKKPWPALLYFSGGGFVLGNLNTCDERSQLLAYFTGCVIISVNYPRAPEHPFPAAAEAGYAVLQWVEKYANKLGVDAQRIGVCGENSGGTIAAALTLMARDREGPAIGYQILVYPMLDNNLDTESAEHLGKDYLMTTANLQWFWQHYLAKGSDRNNPYAVPARAKDLSHLAPAQIITAEYDPVRDEAKAYADRLKDSGVSVSYQCYKGLIHGFLSMYSIVDKVNLVYADIAEQTKVVFNIAD